MTTDDKPLQGRLEVMRPKAFELVRSNSGELLVIFRGADDERLAVGLPQKDASVLADDLTKYCDPKPAVMSAAFLQFREWVSHSRVQAFRVFPQETFYFRFISS